MRYARLALLAVVPLLLSAAPVSAADPEPAAPDASAAAASSDAFWQLSSHDFVLAAADALDPSASKGDSAAKGGAAAKDEPKEAPKEEQAKPGKGPPLPIHTIEGVGGLVITPIAYLVNPGPKGTVFGLPAASVTYVGAGHKNIQTVAVSETLFQRVELSYAWSRFGLGTLGDNVKDATGLDIGRDDVQVHNFNIRGLILEENSFDLPLPSVVAAAQFKVNQGILSINENLFDTLKNKGLDKANGVDYTLTATKTIPKVFGRPWIVSAGIRFSEAAQIGYLGFGDEYHPSLDFNSTYLILDNIALVYEFRQKINQIDRIGKLVRPEDNWQTVGVGWVINSHASLAAGWGRFGNVLDTVEDAGWAIQFKYEF